MYFSKCKTYGYCIFMRSKISPIVILIITSRQDYIPRSKRTLIASRTTPLQNTELFLVAGVGGTGVRGTMGDVPPPGTVITHHTRLPR